MENELDEVIFSISYADYVGLDTIESSLSPPEAYTSSYLFVQSCPVEV